ncbi:hypothetical protein Bca52824_086304 [Brassica carinata]|uniref:Uncharacterized protein n=1 Tax=Brassica carinata TaxID=52824 RepID=A0A8X7TMK6_BRACI|nr:hypothetical protein Bca52824_086304 [Brassica carinata]
MRTRKLGAFEAEYPTFLYAMPMTKTRVFFEVLMLRGKSIQGQKSVVTCQKNLAFGAAASMVHPSRNRFGSRAAGGGESSGDNSRWGALIVLPVDCSHMLSVHFTVIPDEERLLLVDQNEDRQVTSLVRSCFVGNIQTRGLSGGDQSFSPSLRVWVCPRGANATLGRKAMDDPRCVILRLDDSIVGETEGKTGRGKKENGWHFGILGKRCLGVDHGGSEQEEPTLIERESGHGMMMIMQKKTKSTMPFSTIGGNKASGNVIDSFIVVLLLRVLTQLGDGQQQETQSNALVLFGDVLYVEPESYVLPAEEDPDGGEEARAADKQPQSVDSVETSNMKFPKHVERLEKLLLPRRVVRQVLRRSALNYEGPEGEERYDSCKGDMSHDSQIQENPRDLCGESGCKLEDVGSGGSGIA